MEPRVCLVEDILERRGCSLVAVELGEHCEIDVAIIHHVSNHHLKYQKIESPGKGEASTCTPTLTGGISPSNPSPARPSTATQTTRP